MSSGGAPTLADTSDVHHIKTLHTRSVKLDIIGIWKWAIYGLMGGAFMT